MAHFAELDENNVVIQVIRIEDSDCTDGDGVEQDSLGQTFCQNLTGSTNTWKRTSVNTYNGSYEGEEDKDPFRKNFGGLGSIYDASADAFYYPREPGLNSWTLNTTTYQYEAPLPEPADADTVAYRWDEDAYQADNTAGWVVVPAP